MGQRTQPPSCVIFVTGNCPAFGGEEGGADVKSAWSLYPGLHTCYNEQPQRALLDRKIKQIPQICSQWGLRSATRPHERGIGSNRGSAMPR